MSRNNFYQFGFSKTNVSAQYILNELELSKFCPKKNCGALMIKVLVSYRKYGPINYEFECPSCNKIIKDPSFKHSREKHWNNKNRSTKKHEN